MIFPRDDKAHPYIYKIVNSVNGKIYVGQTRNPLRRCWGHLNSKSHCLILRNALNKYGKDSFDFQIIEQCENQIEANRREVCWIKRLKSRVPNGYNIMEGGKNSLHSSETKRKLSLLTKGRTLSLEMIRRISERMIGRTFTLKTRRKLSLARHIHPYIKNDKSSKFRGVTKQGNKWKARIRFLNNLVHLGYFKTEIDAALAYDTKAKELFRKYARLNFTP